MSVTTQQSECTVTIHNDLTGEQREFILPSTVDEAKRNCLEVTRAANYANLLELAAELPAESPDSDCDADLAVTIKKDAGHHHDPLVAVWGRTEGPGEVPRNHRREG